MAQIGGSDGDGGGSRYEKDLAESKRIAEKERNRGSSTNYGDLSGVGGCRDSLLFKIIKWTFIIFVIYAILVIIFKFGALTVDNVANTSTISDFSMTQYLINIGSVDRDAEFKVNSKSINCYFEFDDALEEADNYFKRLESGEKFIYRGCNVEDGKTVVATELVSGEKSIYCYIMIPEEWSGNSFWGNDPSEFITEIKNEEVK